MDKSIVCADLLALHKREMAFKRRDTELIESIQVVISQYMEIEDYIDFLNSEAMKINGDSVDTNQNPVEYPALKLVVNNT